MRNRLWVCSVTWFALVAATPRNADNGFEQIWSEYGAALTADGIDRGMAELAMLWLEGQYHLGRCVAFVNRDDVTYWRNWWNDTPLPQSAFGQRILRGGDESYIEGVQDSRSRPLTNAHCNRVVESWFADMQHLATARSSARATSERRNL